MKRVRAIANSKLLADWEWKVEPFRCRSLAPTVSNPSLLTRLALTRAFLYLTRTFPSDSQLFERQIDEDGDLETREWAANLEPAPVGESDPDDDDNIPIPRVKPPGKDSDSSSASGDSDGDESDCYILDPLDPTPISWAPASVPGKTGAGAGGSRKRASESEEEAAPAPKKVKRAVKKTTSRLKPMPTSEG